MNKITKILAAIAVIGSIIDNLEIWEGRYNYIKDKLKKEKDE